MTQYQVRNVAKKRLVLLNLIFYYSTASVALPAVLGDGKLSQNVCVPKTVNQDLFQEPYIINDIFKERPATYAP